MLEAIVPVENWRRTCASRPKRFRFGTVRVTDNQKKTPADFVETEEGGAAMETGLLLALAAAFAFTLRHVVASPMLSVFTRASKVISQALAG